MNRDLAQRWLEESRTWGGTAVEDRADAERSINPEQADEELLTEARDLVVSATGATYAHRDVFRRLHGQWIAARKAWAFPMPAASSLTVRLRLVRQLRALSGVRVTISYADER